MIRILLIEDNDALRENTAEILALANYEVFTAVNGKDGIEQALKNTPSLIICDVMMPVLDGYGVLHLLHKNDSLKNIPFIFLTAKAERSDFRKGMEMGADDYIVKPFTDIELLTAIETRLKKIDDLQPTSLNINEHLYAEEDSGNALQNLLQNSDSNIYKKKQIIYSEGNHPLRLFYIETGRVKTFKLNEEGKELTIGLYAAGDFAGYTAIIEQTIYKETLEAIEDTTIVIIEKAIFEKLLHNNKNVALQFIKLMARDITNKEKQLVGIAYNSLRKRVAEALIQLQNKYNNTASERFTITISREDLAQIAGTATESMIRTLSDFKAEKLIDIIDGSIVIVNTNKLNALLN